MLYNLHHKNKICTSAPQTTICPHIIIARPHIVIETAPQSVYCLYGLFQDSFVVGVHIIFFVPIGWTLCTVWNTDRQAGLKLGNGYIALVLEPGHVCRKGFHLLIDYLSQKNNWYANRICNSSFFAWACFFHILGYCFWNFKYNLHLFN